MTDEDVRLLLKPAFLFANASHRSGGAKKKMLKFHSSKSSSLSDPDVPTSEQHFETSNRSRAALPEPSSGGESERVRECEDRGWGGVTDTPKYQNVPEVSGRKEGTRRQLASPLRPPPLQRSLDPPSSGAPDRRGSLLNRAA